MMFIAEVKTQSPFGYKSERSWDEMFKIANEVGDIISIHTDARWGGSFELLARARKMTNKPILAKGIHAEDFDIEKAVKIGADYVLVVGRMPGVHIEMCLVEPNTLEELSNLPKGVKAVWNSRDLDTGGLKPDIFTDARTVFPTPNWLCQASNIQTLADIDPSANAFIIGTHLEKFAK